MAHISKHTSIVYRSSQAYFDETLAPYHIGCGQQFFLMRIYEQPGISQFELAETGSFDKGTCARAVKSLRSWDIFDGKQEAVIAEVFSCI